MLEQRVAWAINLLKVREKLNNIQLGQKLGINKNTVGEYSQAKGDMKGVALAALVKQFGFNGEWLMTGRGEPFPGAKEKYPEVCGGPPIPRAVYDRIDRATKAAMAREAQAEYQGAEKQQVDIAIGKAYRVLAADNALSSALFLIIHQFAAALDSDSDLKHCKQQLAEIREEFNNFKRGLGLAEAVPPEQKEAV